MPGAQAADLIDGIDVVIVAVEVGLLGVHILPQSSPQIARLQVVGGQGVSGHQPVDKAVPHQGGKGGPGVGVKGTGRSHDPQDIPMLPFVAEQVVQAVIVDGICGLPAAPSTEGKCLRLAALIHKAIGVDVDSLGAVLRSANHHQFPRPDVTELYDGHRPVPHHGHAVHAAVLRQDPPAANVVILRKQRGGVVAAGHHSVPLRGDQLHIRRPFQPKGGEIRFPIPGNGKTHTETSKTGPWSGGPAQAPAKGILRIFQGSPAVFCGNIQIHRKIREIGMFFQKTLLIIYDFLKKVKLI